jgi:hypothetical protein
LFAEHNRPAALINAADGIHTRAISIINAARPCARRAINDCLGRNAGFPIRARNTNFIVARYGRARLGAARRGAARKFRDVYGTPAKTTSVPVHQSKKVN